MTGVYKKRLQPVYLGAGLRKAFMGEMKLELASNIERVPQIMERMVLRTREGSYLS